VHELCLKRIHVTKRDLFYTDVKLFEARCGRPRAHERTCRPACDAMAAPPAHVLLRALQDQNQSDAVLDDLSCMLGCTRTSLHGAWAPCLQQATLRARACVVGVCAACSPSCIV
jgi:meiotic recombination protein SPO11